MADQRTAAVRAGTIITSAVLLTGCGEAGSAAPPEDVVAAGLITTEVLDEADLSGVATPLEPDAGPLDTTCVSIDGEAMLASDISVVFGEPAFRVVSGSAVFETEDAAEEALASLGEGHPGKCLPAEVGSGTDADMISEDTTLLDATDVGDESIAQESYLNDYEHGIGNDNFSVYTMLAFRVGPSVTVVLLHESAQIPDDTEVRLGLARQIAEVLAEQVTDAL